MGNRYREPRAKSAERLRMTGVQAKIQPDSHQILMTAEFTYDSWDAPIDCDVINAVTVLHEIVEKAFDKASEKRYKKLNAEYAGFLTVTTIPKTVRLWRKTSLLGSRCNQNLSCCD